jgi:hypothetical protein
MSANNLQICKIRFATGYIAMLTLHPATPLHRADRLPSEHLNFALDRLCVILNLTSCPSLLTDLAKLRDIPTGLHVKLQILFVNYAMPQGGR